jgi:hypothetical protein
LGVELLRSYLNANSLDIYTQMKFWWWKLALIAEELATGEYCMLE